MLYPKYNFTLIRGIDRSFRFAFKDKYNTEEESDNYIVFNDCDIVMTIKSGVNQEAIDVLSTMNNRITLGTLDDNGNFIESDTKDIVLVKFSYMDTIEYSAPSMVYDVVKISDNSRELLLTGNIKLLQGVTYE